MFRKWLGRRSKQPYDREIISRLVSNLSVFIICKVAAFLK